MGARRKRCIDPETFVRLKYSDILLPANSPKKNPTKAHQELKVFCSLVKKVKTFMHPRHRRSFFVCATHKTTKTLFIAREPKHTTG